MIARFNGNVVPFADDATSTNRTVFGGTTQSDLIDDNLNTNFKKGWEIVGLNDNPTREDFNAMGYTLGALTAYLYEMGISEWNASQKYRANSRAMGSDGKIYKSLTGTTGIPNVGNNPTTDAVNWELEFKNFVTLTENQTIAGIKTFSSTISGSINGNAGTVTNGVYTTGNQTIAGIKTFSSSPIVPTPTTGTQAANKDYVDSKPTLSIGAILNGYTIFENCIVAFGGLFFRADYPKLWAYLQANPSLVKTEVAWQTENTANGNCGFFGDGNGVTSFRVPNLDKAFLRPDSRGVGSYQSDAFKNHTHAIIAPTSIVAGAGSTGIILSSTGTPNYSTTPSGGTETRPINIAVLPLIVAK